jgi:hypothetical protein
MEIAVHAYIQSPSNQQSLQKCRRIDVSATHFSTEQFYESEHLFDEDLGEHGIVS